MPGLSGLRRITRRIVRHKRPVILMYHRVTTLAHDPWRLAVTPEHFTEHIECLTRTHHVVSLRELVRAITDRQAPRGWAAITFDDGYIDVLTTAKPILERFDCPATAFLATGAIGSSREFWWDTLVRIVFETPTLPKTLAIEVAGERYHWNVVNDRVAFECAEQKDQKSLSRSELHSNLWQLLRILDPIERDRHLEELAIWADVSMMARPTDTAMNPAEVRALTDGLFEVGAHTVTHPSLPALDMAGQRAEIEDSRRVCEELTGTKVTSFAYPFGDWDKNSIAAVRNAGFTTACCTEPRVITPRSDPFRLPRVEVGNWSGHEFARRLAMDFDTP